MRSLDETDMTILEMLSANARVAYSEIGEAVELSAPAVSDRVSRLEEAGIIQGFTLDLDQTQLQGGVPLLVNVTVSPGQTASVRSALDDVDAVEHVFETAAGNVVFHGRFPQRGVRDLLDDIAVSDSDDDSSESQTLAGNGVEEYDIQLLTDVEWTPRVPGSGFALECAECGNSVSNEGVSSRIAGTLYHFCCETCQSRFEERHERMENAV